MSRELIGQLLLVGAGGFVGAILRFVVIGWVQRSDPVATFPLGTLAVNVIGSFLVGVLTGLVHARGLLGPEARLVVLVGLLGAFTTFSTFSYETLALLRAGALVKAFANAAGSVVTCLLAVWVGYALGAARSSA